MLLNIFVETDILFFRIHSWMKIKKQHLFEIETYCNIINAFTVNFAQLNASLVNRSIHFFKKPKHWNCICQKRIQQDTHRTALRSCWESSGWSCCFCCSEWVWRVCCLRDWSEAKPSETRDCGPGRPPTSPHTPADAPAESLSGTDTSHGQHEDAAFDVTFTLQLFRWWLSKTRETPTRSYFTQNQRKTKNTKKLNLAFKKQNKTWSLF